MPLKKMQKKIRPRTSNAESKHRVLKNPISSGAQSLNQSSTVLSHKSHLKRGMILANSQLNLARTIPSGKDKKIRKRPWSSFNPTATAKAPNLA